MPKTFILHDESINSYGFWMPTSGADLTQFKRNPIMLFMHNRVSSWEGKDCILPIGHWDNIRVEKGQILAEPVFDADEFSQLIASKVESGTLRMASAGAKPVDTSSDKKWLKPGQTRETVTKWVMREASIVDIGSNDNALALYDETDKLIELAAGQDIPLRKLTAVEHNQEQKMKRNWLKLGFKSEPNEEEKDERIENLVDENSELKGQNVTLSGQVDRLTQEVKNLKEADQKKKKEEGVALVDAAIKEGRIDAAQKDAYVQLFEVSPENAKTILLAAKPHTPVAGKLEADKGKKEKEYEKLADMTWSQLDKGNKLVKLKAEYPELYAEKFKEQFGTEPNA